MPLYLRRDSIRLFRAAIDALELVILSIGRSRSIDSESGHQASGAEVGLIGVVAELAMSACLVQADGRTALSRNGRFFKTYATILQDFRDLVQGAAPKSEFLVKDVEDPATHRGEILRVSHSFGILGTVRAAGLHAGQRVAWEAAAALVEHLSGFLKLLARSSRLKPYVGGVPVCPYPLQTRELLVEDLAARLGSGSADEEAAMLASIFLVLPDIPAAEPEWISGLERALAVPQHGDLTYLLGVVERAVPATLRRVTGAEDGLAVRVRPTVQGGVAIAPQYLRRTFQQVADRWYADIGNANGRLDDGVLDLPPIESVREAFAVGLEEGELLEEGRQFTAHEAWPFIAASLGYAGTPGPYWFIIRRTRDLGQLIAKLRAVGALASNTYRVRSAEVFEGIGALEEARELNVGPGMLTDLVGDITNAEARRERLSGAITRSRADAQKNLPEDLAEQVLSVEEGESAGPAIGRILASEISMAGKSYWVRLLAEVAIDQDDVPHLLGILEEPGVRAAHTAARKAIARIDFRLFGPALTALPIGQ